MIRRTLLAGLALIACGLGVAVDDLRLPSQPATPAIVVELDTADRPVEPISGRPFVAEPQLGSRP